MRDILRKQMVETPIDLTRIQLLEPKNVRGTYDPEVPGGMLLHLIFFGINEDGTRSHWDIRDIKEQVVPVPEVTDPARAEAIAKGWVRAVTKVLSDRNDVETIVPQDFEIKKDVLALKKAKTPDDFEKAFLAKTRFGKFI